MLEEICREINNWFVRERLEGRYVIENGSLTGGRVLPEEGEYFRIVGSKKNDGVYRCPAQLRDETFTGAVWLMAPPAAFLALAEEIAAWQSRYGAAEGAAMSPFESEAFAGYSYKKATGNGAARGGWQARFAPRLNLWRRARWI